uniref:Uncharacterized protein n=1 Tax=Trichogramma kaykai TaxID=54128 RepID=A0ABD2WMV9_9HYME
MHGRKKTTTESCAAKLEDSYDTRSSMTVTRSHAGMRMVLQCRRETRREREARLLLPLVQRQSIPLCGWKTRLHWYEMPNTQYNNNKK